MTLPVLIANYQKKQTVVRLKSTYSLLQQAVKMAEIDYGEIGSWNFTLNNESFYNTYLKPYLKVIKEFDLSSVPSDYHAYCKDDKAICDNYAGVTKSSTKKFVIENGVLLILASIENSKTVIVDINGFNGPNVWGRDIFLFNTDKEKGIVPYGLGEVAGMPADYEPTKTYLLDMEYRACNQDGVFCAAIIMLDGWEITDEYKW